MNWNEELRNISIGTLFKFCGKLLLGSILWYMLLIAIIMVPMFAIIWAITPK